MEPILKSLSCVTPDVIQHYFPKSGNEPGALTFKDGSVKLVGAASYVFEVSQQFHVVEPEEKALGPYKVSTAAYTYTLARDSGEVNPEIFLYHWHPFIQESTEWETEPHLHVCPNGYASQVRFPTSRIAIEDVIAVLILEFGVKPRRDDWEAVLKDSLDRFRTYRTWHASPKK